MKSNQIKNSWKNIEPSENAQERMFSNILDQVHSKKTTKGRNYNMNTKPFFKIFIPATACLALALTITFSLLNQNNILHTPNIPISSLDQRYVPLIFNNTNAANTTLPSSTIMADRAVNFSHSLTPEQFKTIFPTLELDLSANALYLNDGLLIEVVAFGNVQSAHHLQIRVAEGTVTQTVLFVNEEPPAISYVHGIEVTAITTGTNPTMHFQADFMIDNIAYSISFISNSDTGKVLMTQLVNQIIWGGSPDLSILNDPVIPELRNDMLTFQEAQSDAIFGEFLPINIPYQFNFESANRYISQYINSLIMLWSSQAPYRNSIRWHIATPTEHDIARVVSINNPEKFDMSLYSIPLMLSVPEHLREFVMNPVFLAEEITLEAVKARAELDQRSDGWRMNFSVLYDDIVITLNISGMSPQDVWAMLP